MKQNKEKRGEKPETYDYQKQTVKPKVQ